jgi:tetratricopeptide (TPR) repeat protein
VAGAATFITAGFLALADVVFLTNGNEIQGEVVKEENGRVFLKFPGGILELPRKQIKSIERQPRIDYLVDEGEKMVRRGDFEDAIKILEEAVALDASSARARDALLGAQERWAGYLRELGRFAESRAAFLRLLEKAPEHPRAREEARAIDVTLEEARKEEEKGREEIAGGDMEKGLWRLQRVHDRFADRRKALAPVLAAALIREGDARLSAKSWKEAEERYERALELDPDSLPGLRQQHTIAKVRQIEEILPAGNFAGVEAHASEGLEIDPARGVLRYYRAIALEGMGKAREAAEDYVAILRGPRPQDFKPSALARMRAQAEAKLVEEENPDANRRQGKEDQLAADFHDIRTPHFVIRSKRERTAKEVELIAEVAYEAIFSALGCLTHLRNPIEITVHPTREEYAVSSGMASWSGGSHSVSARRGSLSEHKISCFEEQPRLLTGVVPHEIAHALFAHRLNYPKAIPLWATEGFAILREPEHFHRHYRRLLLQEAARRTLLPIQDVVELATYPDARVGTFYAQSFSLVEFLLSLENLDTFLSFVKALSDREASFDETIRKYYGLRGRVALENRWLGWFENENK